MDSGRITVPCLPSLYKRKDDNITRSYVNTMSKGRYYRIKRYSKLLNFTVFQTSCLLGLVFVRHRALLFGALSLFVQSK